MIDFINSIKNILDEQGKTVDCLFCDKVISKDTFYKYKQRNPSLQTLIKIANYLEVSVDYLYELSDVNDFKPYSKDQRGFYFNLKELINKKKISDRQFCKDMNFQKDIVGRYKNGVEPSVRTLLEIAKYFGCSIDDLLKREE